ncbi:hypothetical protein SteCoe_4106 [Stentor coeruleus]|uniref:EF-hand domain-containing protein n=1 Tax=Stentor coeruleus TaxID=5963 RepID=A0A1R2CVL8_9CILI|nr:hypothetical protein SteCoe_4106 [Stentor coeruleus]
MSDNNFMAEIEKNTIQTVKDTIDSNLSQAISENTTIINVENYPDFEESEKIKNTVDSAFSPRMKQNTPIDSTKNPKGKSHNTRSSKNFNNFLSKMEHFQKAKNDKINSMQALKKEQEDKAIKCIPKVKMSEKSKKILEQKDKKTKEPSETTDMNKISPFIPSPQKPKGPYSSRLQSKTKANIKKPLFDEQIKKTIETNKPKPQQVLKESAYKSEKVLASKFIKEFNKKYDEISMGNGFLDFDETKELFKMMFFLSDYEENVTKKDNEEKLYEKFWKITGCEENKKISMDSLRTFLMGVMNLFLPSMSNGDEAIGLGKVVSERYFLNQNETLRIHKMYLSYYDNRIGSLKKTALQKKVEKFTRMEEVFKGLKCKETKITYGSGNTETSMRLNSILSEKNLRTSVINTKSQIMPSENTEKNLRTSTISSKSQILPTEKKLNKQTTRLDICKTPIPILLENNLNTSFRSARSKSGSRPQSRAAMQSSGRSSVSEFECQAISSDAILDPSVLLKAQDIFGAFSLLLKKDLGEGKDKNVGVEANNKDDKKIDDKSTGICGKMDGSKEKGEIKDQVERGKSGQRSMSKLVYQQKKRLKSVGLN